MLYFGIDLIAAYVLGFEGPEVAVSMHFVIYLLLLFSSILLISPLILNLCIGLFLVILHYLSYFLILSLQPLLSYVYSTVSYASGQYCQYSLSFYYCFYYPIFICFLLIYEN